MRFCYLSLPVHSSGGYFSTGLAMRGQKHRSDQLTVFTWQGRRKKEKKHKNFHKPVAPLSPTLTSTAAAAARPEEREEAIQSTDKSLASAFKQMEQPLQFRTPCTRMFSLVGSRRDGGDRSDKSKSTLSDGRVKT
ncbi:hypothetical protein F2P81_015212 [Scophthalmus maximus]|uniref:Uncharacterized protein n=1 Tax=Scophthalmus maximus TaxID=52904 RepID=A0A6A4SRI3_SCOMX|nr:hypothetical protein F2P81_015212 [Scophthalmus maximus]